MSGQEWKVNWCLAIALLVCFPGKVNSLTGLIFTVIAVTASVRRVHKEPRT